MDVFDKCGQYTLAKEIMAFGVYPYFIPIGSAQGPEISIGGRRLVMMGSNNYLGLADDPRMKEAVRQAVERWGTGCAGSRFLNGTLELHEETERKLAKFKGRESALIFSTGYQTNVGVLSCLVGKGDYLVVDKWDHASILDGGKLSRGETVRFKHNDMEDLDKTLRALPRSAGRLVVVDGVFSMEGDIAKLPEIARISKRHGARVVVDDAHSTGVLGEHGRGTCEHFGLENGEVDLVVGTCSKAFASVGGFVAGPEDVLHFLRHNSRSMIFSAALPPSCVAAISKAIDIIVAEPQRRKRLWENAHRWRDGLKSLGFDIGITETPVIPIVVGDDLKAFQFGKQIFDAGVFANPVVSPAVPPGRALLRTTVMATHTPEQIDRALGIFEDCGHRMGLLPSASRRGVPVEA